MDKQSFAVVIVTSPGYVHSEAFREIAETIFFGLQSGGEDVVWSDTAFVPGRIPIVFGANLVSHPAEIPANAIIYNLEQTEKSSSWMTEPYLTLLRTHRVWDYSTQNVGLFRSQGIGDVQHVPIGYVPDLERIGVAPKDIDVLFYGSMNSRRQQVIEELRVAGVDVRTVFGTYGADRDAMIARARIVLNVHFYDSKIFELAMTNPPRGCVMNFKHSKRGFWKQRIGRNQREQMS